MAKLTLSIPVVGEKNSVADPKITTALQVIEKWANGEVGTTSIEAKAITEALLSVGVVEKLTTKIGLNLEKQNASLEGVAEKLYVMEKEGSTLTLPTPTLNRMIGITCASSINAVKVTAVSGKIFSGLNQAGATTVEVTKAETIIVEATGANWVRIAGEEKPEAKYVIKTYTKAEIEAGVEPSATRRAEVIIYPPSSGVFVFNGIGGVVTPVVPANTPFIVPPGQTWKGTVSLAATMEAATLLL